MNFCGFSFDSETRGQVSRLAQSGRLPHAVIIESKSEEQAKNLAALLSAYAVCEGEDKPCGVCRQCKNALANAHPDIKKLEPDKKSKSGIYSIEQIRDLSVDAQVRPNDADAKVYIFEEADKRFPEVQQNAFLKLLEEPPQRIYFLLLVKSAKALLPTIRSRCTVIRTGGEEAISDEAAQSAKEIITGILSPREYELILAMRALTEKTQQAGILLAVKNHLRDALVTLSGGDANSDKELARKLASKLTRKKIIEMIELTDSCDYKLRQNININLLTTWLCGEYRRILWQR
ncbi:MAG: hypothetical protein IJG99_07795 [Ruminococcus sp.]|nr:hypothetical protein [Ruminococcus sp.]